MKTTGILIAVLLLAGVAAAQPLVRTKDAVANGGTDAWSADSALHLRATVGQAVIGVVSTSEGAVYQGFWTPDASVAGIEISRAEAQAPDFTLDQNYPNPYSSTTLISFSVPRAIGVTLQVFSMTGVLVKTLVDDNVSPGRYNVTFDASDLPPGTYLYSLRSAKYVLTKRMVVIR
jgi:hypothetical protein